MKKEKQDKTLPERPEPLVIGSVAQLKELTDATVPCRFELAGRPVEVRVRRVSCGVAEKRREILRKPVPPFRKERNEHDQLDPAYLAARELAATQARSYTVYHCCPIVQEAKPGLVTPEEIHAHVRDLFPELVVEIIAATADAGAVTFEGVQGRADFT